MHIGNILKNTTDGSLLGAIVYTYPNKIIIFRNINGLNPGIFKMPIEDLNNPTIATAGNINEPEFEPIKKALLKYFRRPTLPETEKAVFGKIMEFAFPNGVPLYDDIAERMPDEATRAIRLADHLQPGKCLYINASRGGPFEHLDNQCIYVLGGDEHGIWVCPHQSGTEFITSFLPFKDRNVPKFWSVNRLLPGEIADDRGAQYLGKYLQAKTQLQNQHSLPNQTIGNILSQINHGDTRLKLQHDPKTGIATIVIPQKLAGQIYDFTTGTIKSPVTNLNAKGKLSSIVYDNEHGVIINTKSEKKEGNPANEEQPGCQITAMPDESITDLRNRLEALECNPSEMDENHANNKPAIEQPIIIQTGGANKSEAGDTEGSETEAGNTEGSETEAGNTEGSETEDDDSSEQAFNENDLVFLDEDEPVIEVEKVQKIRQMPVPDLEKVFKESIQKGHIYKQKLEKLPTLLRDNPYYKDRVTKDVNLISLLKAQMTTESRMVLAQPADYHPLIETMLKADYTNHFLVPLVVTTKKLYLTKKDPITKEDLAGPTAAVEPDFHKYMSEWCAQNARGGMRKMVDINENLTRIMTEAAPHLPAAMSHLGLMVRFGEGIRPEEQRNRDTTVKLKTTRAQESIEYLAQATQAIRFGSGGREFALRNFELDSLPFDSHVVLGPLANYSNIHKTEYTISEIEAMEEEVDKNIAAIGAVYNIHYLGDNTNLVGFVRPPVMNFLQGRGESQPSLVAELSAAEDKGQIVIRYLDAEDNTEEFSETGAGLIEPDKFVVYLFQDPGAAVGSGPTLTDDIVRGYLTRMVPRFEDITRLFADTYRVEQPGDLERLIEILYKFDYIVPHREGLSLAASRTQPDTHLRAKADANWENIQALNEVEDRIVRAMVSYNNKMDKIHRLRQMRDSKTKEKNELKSDTKHGTRNETTSPVLITDSVIELADKIYAEKYVDVNGTGPLALSDESRMDYYAHQPDRAQYINLLLRKMSLLRMQDLLKVGDLESNLGILKEKYEASGRKLPADLTARVSPETLEKTQLGKCAGGDAALGGRKPRILKYPTVARMKEDNGRNATTPSGDLVLEGDYALVDESGKKLIFRRERLNDGDYWIGQPISVLEQLLYKKRATCAASGAGGEEKAIPTQAELDTARAAMRLPEEQLVGLNQESDAKKIATDPKTEAECMFDLARLQCLPVDIIDMDRDLAQLHARIMDINGQLAFARAIPPLLAECEKSITAIEKEIRNYNHGITLVEKYYTALVAQQQKELEAFVKRRRDCPHFGVITYLDGLLNLSDQERYLLVKEIIQRFQNQEQAAGLDLLSISTEGTMANNVACFVCNQALMCKHYLFALELMENSPDGMLDEVTLRSTYGELQGGTYYCRSCGAPLGNTEVLDVEEFEKDGGKEGMHVKTREVMEDIGVIERQKAAVDKIITAAINDDQDDDMKTKLRLYKLAKDLLTISVMSVDDELSMVNFMKTYEFIPRKTFYNLIYLRFLKAKGGQVAGINKSAIDNLANEQYWRHVTCDILGHLLIIIQTSLQTYTVFNKLCATNNYMGWPLLGTGVSDNIPDEDQGGIEIMFCLIKQIAILPEFKHLSGSEGSEIGTLRGLLIKRIDEQVRNNEIVRTRLDRALDTKYNQITLMEEFRMNWTNYWPSYRPVMAGTIPGGVKWTPARDLEPDSAKNWTAKGLRAMLGAGWDNIAYQSQVLAHNLTSVVEKETPANRIMLMNTVANSCCPIDYVELRAPSAIAAATTSQQQQHDQGIAQTAKSKFLNPEINYYMKLEKTNDPIRNALKRIAEYTDMIKALENQVSCPRIRVVFPYVSKDFKPLDMTLKLDQEELKAYFIKYIDSGPFKGSEHIFDPFGRCIISGAIKDEVADINYTQTDFEKLLAFVERQKIIQEKPQAEKEIHGTGLPDSSPEVLIRLMHLLKHTSNKLVNLAQLVEMAPKLTEVLDHNITLNKELLDLCRDLELLVKLRDGLSELKNVSGVGKRAAHLGVIYTNLEKLAIARLNEVLVAHLGLGFKEYGATGASRVTNRVQQAKGQVKPGLTADFKKEYYGLLTLIDTEKQGEITEIVDAISGTKKEELGLEQILINLGELRDIGRDIREFMERQARIVPHYEYVNHDREQEIQHHIVRGEFIRKLIADVRYIIMLIKNDAWADLKTAADIPDYLSEFFKYKDAGRLFRDKFGDLAQQLDNISQHLDEINEGSIFGAELVDSLLAYLFTLLLGIIISKVGDSNSKNEKAIIYDIEEGGHEKPELGDEEDIPMTNSDNEFDFIAAVDRAKGLTHPDHTNQMNSEMNSEMNQGDVESNDLELYPEFVGEGQISEFENEPGMQSGGGRPGARVEAGGDELNLPQKAKEVKTTQRRLVVDFVRDVVLYVRAMSNIYNEMNLDRIKEQMARTQEKQTKLNLAAPKFLKQEGMEDDYRLVMNLINLGFMQYKDLNNYMQDHYGDEVFRQGAEEEYDQQHGTQFADDDAEGIDRDEEARRNKYGLDNVEMAEMGYVGAMEDMEEMDYGYMGVDEN